MSSLVPVLRLGLFSSILAILVGRVGSIPTLIRRTRSVGLTNGGRINIGVQFVLPLTLTLPPVKGYARRDPRSLEQPPDDPEYDLDPDHGPQLRKLDHYFHHLSIDEEPCRLRLLCEMAADPDSFYPLSDLVLAKISDVGHTDASSKGFTSRMQNYEHAVYLGLSDNGTCSKHYGHECEDGPTDLVNLPLLTAWQLISDFFDIGLYNDLDT